MRQADLEAEMREAGIHRYQKKAQRTKQGEMESQHPVGRRLLTESVERLTLRVQDWKKDISKYHVASRSAAYEYIAMLPANMVAALTARSVINSISMHEKITKAAFKVAKALEDECRWRKMRRDAPDLWRDQKKRVKKIPSYATKRRFLNNAERLVGLEFNRWPRTAKLKVGVVLIELMKQATGIIDITTRTGLLGKKETWVHPTDQLMEWMKHAHNYAEDLSPMYLPMVERPNPPKDVYTSGYLTNNIPPRPLIKTRDKDHLADLDAIGIESTRETVRILQDVQWEIDPVLYETMVHCWESEIEIGDLPPANGQPIPSRPVDIDTNEEARRKWRKAAARIHNENSADRSRRLQITKVLWIAKKFLGRPIYFPWYCDFRGRKYPRPHFLHPHSFEEGAALLRFYKGKPIGDGGDWLAIHGASVYGEDKLPFDERVQWVNNNKDMILEVANDPKRTTWIWGKADKPWKFLAFCLEWRGYLENGKDHITKLPIQIDGSSNGLQLYSLLMRDPVGAEATNVLPAERPRDIYADVAAGTLQRLQNSDNPYAAKWLAFGVDRACCKRPTMVVPYSATLHACITYTIDWYRDELKKKKMDNP
ncbi:MAG: hypothetical protein QGF32_06495, partial [Candidatus Thalassarchaeaceae archaeon]|nr:hypothetical protein [Candidatus Thalassarchaeaceae archaeon]